MTPRLVQLLSCSALIALAASPTPAQIGVTPAVTVDVPLPADAHDIEFDATRDRYYVSVPDANQVVVISASTFQIETSVTIAPRPTGIDVSHDASTLFVALNQGSGIAYVDLDTLQVTDTVNLGVLLDHPTTWDVAEGRPDWIFVSANPSSGGFAYVVLVRRDLGNSASRVASNRIIRAAPTFHKDPTQQFLYVGEGFSPNSLYKLDLSQPTAPIVLEDNHGAVSGTQQADVSFDGSQIFLRSGQILSTADFTQTGVVGGGVSRLNGDASRAYVMTSNQLLEAFDTTTQLPVLSQPMPCPPGSFFSNVRDLYLDPGATIALALVDDRLCGVTTAPVPALQSVTPDRARFDAGPTPVTITGSFFTRSTLPEVHFGGVPATDVSVVDDNTLTCTAPAGDPGPKAVTITNGNGTGELADGFAHTPALFVGGDLVPGGAAALRVLHTPRDRMMLYASLGSPISTTLPGLAGTLCLPTPIHLLSVPQWPLDELTVTLAIPPDPMLSGLRVLTQMLAITESPAVSAITNCGEVVVR